MWDKPRVLLWVANGLYALAAAMFLYAVLFTVVRLPIFPLREVRVEGDLGHVTREQIRFIVSRHLRGNFFTLQLEHARDAFRKVPWIRNVSVRRRWPDKLEVVMEEHHALARWGTVALVNTHGELFHAAYDAELPVFEGPPDGVREIAEQYGACERLLQAAGMHITQVALSPRRAWELTTDRGMVIALGREESRQRLQKFLGVYAATLGRLNVQVAYADLRYPNGFAVRKPARVTQRKS